MQVAERSAVLPDTGGNAPVLDKLRELYHEAMAHDGYAEIKVDIRILRRGQKEVILHCGKQYRYVVDYVPSH